MSDRDLPPAVVVPARPVLTGMRGPGTDRSRAAGFRLVAHLAAWLPFVIGAIRSAQQDLPVISDGAAIALRSWDALTPYGPLVGQATQLRNGAFDPGPLQYWLLAIPVHIDPRQGVVWGAALWCIVASSLAIEAARSALGPPGGLAASGIIIGAVAWQPLIAAQPYWNPWFGMMFFLAVLAAALAVMSGRRRWWPVLVTAASVAAQAHLMFALASAALVLVALVAGLADTVRARAGYWWAAAGLLAGAACWTAPLIQQFTSRYPNLSLLLASLGKQRPAGTAFGLRALGASTLHPVWWVPSLSLRLHGVGGDIGAGSPAFGVAVLALTAVVLIVAVRPLRSRRLAALATVNLLTSGAVLTTYSNISAHDIGHPSQNYLLIVLLPAGLLAWLTLGSAVVLAARRVASQARALPVARLRPLRPGGEPGSVGGSAARWAVAALGAAAIVLLGMGSWLAVAQQARASAAATSARQVSATRYAADYIESLVPRERIALSVRTGQGVYARSVTLGVAWMLRADGYQLEVDHRAARYLGPRYRYAGRPMLLVTVILRYRGVVVRLGEASLTQPPG
jgi:hypothetical protein